MESDSVYTDGGLTITKRKEATPEIQKFTCSNPSCGRDFTNPIRAKNLASKEAESYDACPYCLTEIVLEEETTAPAEKESEQGIKEMRVKESGVRFEEEKTAPVPSKMQGCAHHFGYLSTRSSKEKIPEECIVCENIVQCMLKKVTG